jgi:hypothetical protein
MARKKKHDFEYAVVTGTGMFPFDMLRYDGCSPAFETQAHLLEELHSYDLEVRFIVLKRFNCQMSQWTPDRWASFGWQFAGPYNEPHEAERAAKARIQSESAEKHSCPFCEVKRKQAEEKRLAVNQQAVFDSLTELVNSPNMKSNAMWDRAVIALRPAKKVK